MRDAVTDMLLAMLNCCTKEELEESSDEDVAPVPVAGEEFSERKKVIKNKILAVGRMSRVFALLRYVCLCFDRSQALRALP